MTNFSLLMAEFYEKQKEYNYLQSIFLKRNVYGHGCSEYDSHIILCACPSHQKNKTLKIEFTGVRNFKMGDIDGLLFLSINIVDISKDQLEDIYYKVREEEHDLFSFYCKSFTFQEISEE